jgi:hypothetical protein
MPSKLLLIHLEMGLENAGKKDSPLEDMGLVRILIQPEPLP